MDFSQTGEKEEKPGGRLKVVPVEQRKLSQPDGLKVREEQGSRM